MYDRISDVLYLFHVDSSSFNIGLKSSTTANETVPQSTETKSPQEKSDNPAKQNFSG